MTRVACDRALVGLPVTAVVDEADPRGLGTAAHRVGHYPAPVEDTRNPRTAVPKSAVRGSVITATGMSASRSAKRPLAVKAAMKPLAGKAARRLGAGAAKIDDAGRQCGQGEGDHPRAVAVADQRRHAQTGARSDERLMAVRPRPPWIQRNTLLRRQDRQAEQPVGLERSDWLKKTIKKLFFSKIAFFRPKRHFSCGFP